MIKVFSNIFTLELNCCKVINVIDKNLKVLFTIALFSFFILLNQILEEVRKIVEDLVRLVKVIHKIMGAQRGVVKALITQALIKLWQPFL